MTATELELAGLRVLQDLVIEKATGGHPSNARKYAELAEIALGIVEDLLRSEAPNPELALQSLRNSVKEDWARRIRDRFR